ncbi:MAG: YggU family protein [DPANN group archaeon]|nr:YggU family protein [DPANN group archaeon]
MVQTTDDEANSMMKQTQNGTIIEVEVTTNGRKFGLRGIDPWTQRLKIKLTQRAQDNKANQELIQETSRLFKADVIILKGSKSNKKTLLVNTGIDKIREVTSQ